MDLASNSQRPNNLSEISEIRTPYGSNDVSVHEDDFLNVSRKGKKRSAQNVGNYEFGTKDKALLETQSADNPNDLNKTIVDQLNSMNATSFLNSDGMRFNPLRFIAEGLSAKAEKHRIEKA